jgi:hypothetical protein
MVAGVIIAVVGWGLALFLYSLQRRTKQLDYLPVTNRNIVWPTNYSESGDIEVTYKGCRLTAPRLAVLRLMNTGRMSIKVADFQTPVRFRTKPEAEIKVVEITRRHPDGLAVEARLESRSTFLVEPFLSHPREWIELQLVLDGPHCTFVPEGRIADVQSIRLLRDVDRRTLLQRFVLPVVVVTLLAGEVGLIFGAANSDSTALRTAAIGLGIGASISLTAVFFAIIGLLLLRNRQSYRDS